MQEKINIKRFQVLLVFLNLLCSYAMAQHTVSGVVIDSITREPLPFVNIVINNEPKGGISDIDGRFTLKSDVPIKTLKFSFLGYKQKVIEIKDEKRIIVELNKNVLELPEIVIVPGENPAHRIIKNVLKNREINNPFNLKSFEYEAYNRFHVSADIEVLQRKDKNLLDTTEKSIIDYFEKRYIFLMESISKRKYLKPNKSEEKIISTKVAGFSNPIFTLLMSQVQSFAFYNDLISISDKNYVNPISEGSTEKYLFLLNDTLFDDKDTIFVISFRPFKNTNFDGLEGLLYIHTDRWAIKNVIAAPAREDDKIGIKIQQQYERIGEEKVWFPTQLNTEVFFKNVLPNNVILFGQGRTYLHNIEINPQLKRKNFSNAEVLFEQNNTNADSLWNYYRKLYSTKKDSATYSFLDSLGREKNFDKLLNNISSLLSGKIPIGVVDLAIFEIIKYNEFERWRTTLKFETNNNLSKNFIIGGKIAYSTGDRKFKRGLSLQYVNHKLNTLSFKVAYSFDSYESGGIYFIDEQDAPFSYTSLRSYFIKTMDYCEDFKFSSSINIGRYSSAAITFKNSKITATNNYLFGEKSLNSFIGTNIYETNEIIGTFFYDRNQKRIKGIKYNYSLLSAGNKPIIKIEFKKALDLWSRFPYNAIDIRFTKRFVTKYFGTSEFVLQSGIVDRAVPYYFLRVLPSAYNNFGLYSPYSFQTVRMNEFVTDRYVYLFWLHNFGKLIYRKKYFSPEIKIALNAAWGDIKNIDKHYSRINLTAPAPSKGLFETGLIIDEIIKLRFYGFGFAVFYRTGNYQFPKTIENFNFSMSFKIIL